MVGSRVESERRWMGRKGSPERSRPLHFTSNRSMTNLSLKTLTRRLGPVDRLRPLAITSPPYADLSPARPNGPNLSGVRPISGELWLPSGALGVDRAAMEGCAGSPRQSTGWRRLSAAPPGGWLRRPMGSSAGSSGSGGGAPRRRGPRAPRRGRPRRRGTSTTDGGRPACTSTSGPSGSRTSRRPAAGPSRPGAEAPRIGAGSSTAHWGRPRGGRRRGDEVGRGTGGFDVRDGRRGEGGGPEAGGRRPAEWRRSRRGARGKMGKSQERRGGGSSAPKFTQCHDLLRRAPNFDAPTKILTTYVTGERCRKLLPYNELPEIDRSRNFRF